MNLPLLSLLIFAPLLGAGLLWLVPARHARWAATGSMLPTLVFAVAAVTAFDPGGQRFQLLERQPWIAGLNIHYQLGVDGLSVLFLPATALLFLASLAAAWNARHDSPRLYFGFLLLLETATLGIFCALDTILFFSFWELTLIPLYFLLGRWGATAAGAKVAARYFLLMLAGGIPLLLAFLLLAGSQPVPTFDMLALLAVPLPHGVQYAVLLLCLIGFGIKVPLVPLHTWLPQFALAAPGSLTALLVGLKLGAYGLIRLAIPLAPVAAQEMHWLLAGAGTLSLLYGALGILAQTNLRVGLAYAGVCHVGLAILGLSAFSAQGAQGAVALLLSFPLAAGGGLLLTEFLRQRTGSTDVRSLGGVAKTMPLLASGFLLCGLAGMGMPGTSGFPGELLVLLATLKTHTGAGLGALFGLVVAAAGFLALYTKAFLGPVTRPEVAQARDLQAREWAILVVLVALILGIGLYPGPWLDILQPAAEAWAAGFRIQ